jgi:uncharacterized protein YegL
MSSPGLMSPRRPGGQMSSRPLHFIWLADGSGSMRVDGKMQALNSAIREAIPDMRSVARVNPHASVFVKAIRFADDARWLGEKLTPASDFDWPEMEAGGVTALGEALTMLGDALQPPLMTDRALPPVIVLVTDGLPTDDFHAGLAHLLSKPWGQRALRIVVAIGEDAAGNEAQEIFRAFTGNDALRPLQANNPEMLAEQIRWVSTAVLQSVVSPVHLAGMPGATKGLPGVAVPVPNSVGTINEAGVW